MATSCCARVLPSSFHCRPDPHFPGSSPRPNTKTKIPQTRFVPIHGGLVSSAGLSSMILKFPPNFVRQLSTKARRNCSNIGVAQVVAASWSNNKSSSAVPASTTAVNPASAAPLEDVNVVDGARQVVDDDSCSTSIPVQFKGSAALKASFLRSDGSLSVHAGTALCLPYTRSFLAYVQ